MVKDENIHIQEDSEATYDHVIKYTGLFGGVQGITMLMNIVRNKLVALLLGPQGIALINMFGTVLKLVSQSTNFGMSFSAVKHIAEIHETGDHSQLSRYAEVVRTWSLFTGLLGMFILMALAQMVSVWTFSTEKYTSSILLLSPAVVCLAISGGELAILKGTKHLKKVALTSVFASIITLIVCVPIYFYMGMEGVVLSLTLTNILVMLIQVHYSGKVIPWHISIFSKSTYLEGMPMIKLGVGYIIAGIFGQGAEYLIRTLIIRWGCLADVGIYNSGYVMAVTYASMVFIAIEADYFPRLSATKDNVNSQNATVNQQIEVCVLLIAPFLMLFVTAMPLIVQILYSSKFMDAVPMAICASFYMFFKALTLPAAYLSLAHGDSKMYMITELVYDIVIAIAIPLAYLHWGLVGTGLALSVSGCIDMLMIHICYRHCYSYRFSTRLLSFYIIQFLLLCTVVCVSAEGNLIVRYATQIVAFGISAFMSLKILNRETEVVAKLKNKIWKKK